MKLVELKQILEGIGYPVAYSHFAPVEGKPIPAPPYICYLVAYSSNMFADDQVYHEIDNVDIELYTTRKDLVAEGKLQAVLQEHELPYETTETYLESEKLYQKIYEVRLI